MTDDARAASIRMRLEQLGPDVGYGLRQLRRNPAFSAVAIATLALGISVNTAMSSAVDAVLIRPLPYADSHRLVALWTHQGATDSASSRGLFATPPDWKARRSHNTVLAPGALRFPC